MAEIGPVMIVGYGLGVASGVAKAFAGQGHLIALRLCRMCGRVGCCHQSSNRHATAHFRQTGHPIIEGYDPPESCGWCYVDDTFINLPDQTPQREPIPRFY